jgi:hypothetical protein
MYKIQNFPEIVSVIWNWSLEFGAYKDWQQSKL